MCRERLLTPYAQLVDWLHIDQWAAHGFGTPGTSESKCECYTYWGGRSNIGRKHLEQALLDAESLFVSETGYYPWTQNIEEEWQYKGKFRVKPQYSCHYQSLGCYTWNELETIVLTKDDGNGGLLDEIILTFTIPAGVDVDDVRVLYTETDCPRQCDYGYNTLEYEIRPYSSITCSCRPDDDPCSTAVDTECDITITIPSYLLMRPSLFEEEDCVEKLPSNIVDELLVGYYTYTTDGTLIFENTCCEKSCCTVCVSEYKSNYRDTWFDFVLPSSCSCNTCSLTCDAGRLRKLEACYNTGCEPNVRRLMCHDEFTAIARLTVALLDCIITPCKCDTCASQKIDYYRTVPDTLVNRDTSSGQTGYEWQVIVDSKGLAYADGLMPTIGIIQAMRWMKEHQCDRKDVGAKYIS